MQFAHYKTVGDIRLSDIGGALTSFLSLEAVKKTAFIIFSAAVLTVIVLHSGTSYTPLVDVFVYCIVYSMWITMCLPWLVQNMNGKLLCLLIGVVFRLFAVDVGVLAWSAFRGQRNLMQRGLRMRPMFEPSMSWLAEAGYNLRYGVIISTVVASVMSFLIDFYDKLSEGSKIQRKSKNSKSSNLWDTSEKQIVRAGVRANKNPLHPCFHGKAKWGRQNTRESTHFCLDDNVRLKNTDISLTDPQLNLAEPMNGHRRDFPHDYRRLAVRNSYIEADDDNHPRGVLSQENVAVKEEYQSKVSSFKAGYKCSDDVRNDRVDNSLHYVEVSACNVYPDKDNKFKSDVSYDRTNRPDMGQSLTASQCKENQGVKRAESVNREINKEQRNMIRSREGCVKRDHWNYASDVNNKRKYERENDTGLMEGALNESLNSLRKLRGKI